MATVNPVDWSTLGNNLSGIEDVGVWSKFMVPLSDGRWAISRDFLQNYLKPNPGLAWTFAPDGTPLDEYGQPILPSMTPEQLLQTGEIWRGDGENLYGFTPPTGQNLFSPAASDEYSYVPEVAGSVDVQPLTLNGKEFLTLPAGSYFRKTGIGPSGGNWLDDVFDTIAPAAVKAYLTYMTGNALSGLAEAAAAGAGYASGSAEAAEAAMLGKSAPSALSNLTQNIATNLGLGDAYASGSGALSGITDSINQTINSVVDAVRGGAGSVADTITNAGEYLTDAVGGADVPITGAIGNAPGIGGEFLPVSASGIGAPADAIEAIHQLTNQFPGMTATEAAQAAGFPTAEAYLGSINPEWVTAGTAGAIAGGADAGGSQGGLDWGVNQETGATEVYNGGSPEGTGGSQGGLDWGVNPETGATEVYPGAAGPTTRTAATGSSVSRFLQGLGVTKEIADVLSSTAPVAALFAGLMEGNRPSQSSTTVTYPEWYSRGAQSALSIADEAAKKPFTRYAPTTSSIGTYMNPYLEGALAPALDTVNRTFDTIQTRNDARAGMTGAFGGDRALLEKSLNNEARGKAVGALVGPAYATAYDKALGMDYGETKEERDYPSRLISNYSQALRGSGDSGRTVTQTQPAPSLLSQAVGALGAYSTATAPGGPLEGVFYGQGGG